VCNKSAKQPKWKSKRENQDKEVSGDLFNDVLVVMTGNLLDGFT